MILSTDPDRALRQLGLFMAALSAALLLGALGFQYLGGYPPCALCHDQRYGHIGVIVLALAGLAVRPRSRRASRALLALAALALLLTAGIAGFHVGVEERWWDGPTGCSGGSTLGLTPEEALKRLMETPVVRCDDVAWSMFGISMAGYNFLISAIAGVAALAGLAMARRGRHA